MKKNRLIVIIFTVAVLWSFFLFVGGGIVSYLFFTSQDDTKTDTSETGDVSTTLLPHQATEVYSSLYEPLYPGYTYELTRDGLSKRLTGPEGSQPMNRGISYTCIRETETLVNQYTLGNGLIAVGEELSCLRGTFQVKIDTYTIAAVKTTEFGEWSVDIWRNQYEADSLEQHLGADTGSTVVFDESLRTPIIRHHQHESDDAQSIVTIECNDNTYEFTLLSTWSTAQFSYICTDLSFTVPEPFKASVTYQKYNGVWHVSIYFHRHFATG